MEGKDSLFSIEGLVENCLNVNVAENHKYSEKNKFGTERSLLLYMHLQGEIMPPGYVRASIYRNNSILGNVN
jgi:hypothetical protein